MQIQLQGGRVCRKETNRKIRLLHGHDARIRSIEVETHVGASAVAIAVGIVESTVEAEAINISVHTHGGRSSERTLEFVVVAKLRIEGGILEPAGRIFGQGEPCRRTKPEFREHAHGRSGGLSHRIFEDTTIDERRGLSWRNGERQGELNIAEVSFAWTIRFVRNARVGKGVWQNERSRANRSRIRGSHVDPSNRT